MPAITNDVDKLAQFIMAAPALEVVGYPPIITTLSTFSIYESVGSDTHVVLELDWNQDGREYHYAFTEKELREAKVNRNKISIMIHDDSKIVYILLYNLCIREIPKSTLNIE